MIEKIIITSLLVFAIWYSMQPGEIFGFIQYWFAPLNNKLKDPLYNCAACMAVWHGSWIYWLIWGAWLKCATWQEWLIVVISSMGLNAVIMSFWPPATQ